MRRGKKIWLIRVVGDGQFPFDMLRYDRCWPATETYSAELTHGHDGPRRTVILMTESDKLADRRSVGIARLEGHQCHSGERPMTYVNALQQERVVSDARSS